MAHSIYGKGRMVSIWILRIVLGLIFAYIGYTKLSGTGNTVEYFTAIGWGQWFRYLTGLLDVSGAVLLFIPRATSFGSLILACSAGTATVLAFTILHGDPTWGAPPMALIPLVLTSLAATLSWLTHPHRTSTKQPQPNRPIQS